MNGQMDPSGLNGVDLTDALVYRLDVETRKQTAVLTIGIDPRYHIQAAKLFGIEENDPGMIALVFSGVRSAALQGMVSTPPALAPDEPPHEYEISSAKVSRRSHGGGFQVQIGCQNGQRCEIEFTEMRAERSIELPGVIHDYEA